MAGKSPPPPCGPPRLSCRSGAADGHRGAMADTPGGRVTLGVLTSRAAARRPRQRCPFTLWRPLTPPAGAAPPPPPLPLPLSLPLLPPTCCRRRRFRRHMRHHRRGRRRDARPRRRRACLLIPGTATASRPSLLGLVQDLAARCRSRGAPDTSSIATGAVPPGPRGAGCLHAPQQVSGRRRPAGPQCQHRHPRRLRSPPLPSPSMGGRLR